MSKSDYEVLGITPDASQEEIKKAHRALVNKFHPDMYINNPLVDLATERMQEINVAYSKLTNQQSTRQDTKYTDDKENKSKQQNSQSNNQQRFEEIYQEALRKKVNGQTESDFLEAAVLFRGISGYKDSSLLATECDDLANKVRVKQRKYQKALEKKVNGRTENDFVEAAVLFRSIDGYKDSSLLANECDDLANKVRVK